MVPLQRDLAPEVEAPAGSGGASAAEPAFAVTAATDDESPAGEDVRAAVLGVLLDRWTQGHRSATVSFDGLVDGVAAQVPHASVELVRHAVQRLAEDRYLLYEPGSETVKLRARGVDGYEELTGRSPMPGEVLRAVLEALYEQARHSPNQPRLSREALLEEADVPADALDRMIWYLSDVGKRVGDVYVDDWAGYVDLVTRGDGNPWWTSAALNEDGKRLYENLP